VFVACFRAYAQDFDNMMVKKQLDCSDVSYNSALLFEIFFTENKLDSAKNLLSYWEGKCGRREPIQRAKILLALKENNYQDSLLSENILYYVFNYQNRMDMIKYNNFYDYDNYKPYYSFIPVGQEFDKFTQKEFEILKSAYNTNQIEYLWSEFYSDNSDTIFSKLQSGNYESTLETEYNKVVKKYASLPDYHLSWITGIWIPTGKLKTLGVHPELGFQAGVKYKKMSYDLTMSFRFLKSANEYYAKRRKTDVWEATGHFFGGYIGFDVGRDIYTKKKHELQIIGGIAADGFDALEENKDLNLKSASVWSYNFNLGLGYRYYFSKGLYLGLRAKYNVVDYKLGKVVDLTGNTVTIQFIVGGLSNAIKDNNLKALKYKSWQ
jgi:hypothetical protein